MGYLAFVPLYEDMCLLAGTDNTAIQVDRNESLESGYFEVKESPGCWWQRYAVVLKQKVE